MASVELIDISKKYPDGKYAVKDFNLAIDHGEFVVFVGPSGCGKSTTLNMINGLDEPTHGSIRLGDRLVNHVPPKNRDIAMVFQNYALYPQMSVQENMGFALKLRGYKKKDVAKKVCEAADLLGLTSLLNRLPRELSGGQRQRVALGRAIVRDASVYLFDEPLSNLDANLRNQMRIELRELHKKLGATMIYVTHDQVEAMTLGDRIVVMEDGEIQQVDTPMNIYHNPKNRFVAGFTGTPSMNFIDGTISKRSDQLIFHVDDTDISWHLQSHLIPIIQDLEKKQITLGIRPENISLARNQEHLSSPRIKGRVRVIEQLGSESIVHIQVSEHLPIIARLNGSCRVNEGEIIETSIDQEKFCFFDTYSGHSVEKERRR